MIVVADYGVGNPGSIAYVFKKIGTKAAASSDPALIQESGRKKVCILVFFDIAREL